MTISVARAPLFIFATIQPNGIAIKHYAQGRIDSLTEPANRKLSGTSRSSLGNLREIWLAAGVIGANLALRTAKDSTT
jgi:hypothetical protein